jgi:hypothetical protein
VLHERLRVIKFLQSPSALGMAPLKLLSCKSSLYS